MTVEAAYREVGPKIVGYLVATGTDEATARDLLHDAFARIVARGERPGDDLCALAFVTARNLRANLLRDGSRLSVVERPEDLDERTTDGLRETDDGWDGALYDFAGVPAARPVKLRWIPYYAWANRGVGEMRVWVRAE